MTVIALPASGLAPGIAGIGQGAAAGLAGGLASQAVGVATGIQSKFDFKGLALSAIGGAVNAGVGQILGKGAVAGSQIFGDVARGALSSAVTQGVGVATGLQGKFNWASVAAAGVMAGVGGVVSRSLPASMQSSFGGDVITGAASVMAGAATRAAITGTGFGDNVAALLPDAIGQVVGRALGSAADQALATAAETSQQATAAPSSSGATSVGNEAEIIVTGRLNISGLPYSYSFWSPEVRIALGSIDGTFTPEEAKALNDRVLQIKRQLYKDRLGHDHIDSDPMPSDLGAKPRYTDGEVMDVRLADPIDLGTLFAQKQEYLATYEPGKATFSRQQYNDIMAAYDAREALIREWDAEANRQIDRFFGGFILSGVVGGGTLALGGGAIAYLGLEGGSAFLANSVVGGFTAANQNGTFVTVNGGDYSLGDYGRDFAVGTVATGGFMGLGWAARGVSNRLFASRIGAIDGGIEYGALDALGRPTGVRATITQDMIGTGTAANPSIIPPGWSGNGRLFNEARGHLLGRQLGGSGDLAENLVTLQQNPANSPVMRGFENQVRSAVEGGQVVRYSSTPVYNGSNLAPRGITLSGKGSGGFDLNVTVLNPAGW
ncbi:hypothetical protein HY78_24315 [Rhizorhabdus wittichii DC-6]|nr:hypothetical protein HY78_24315 [Rhizorhabdus wittichii DC-6]